MKEKRISKFSFFVAMFSAMLLCFGLAMVLTNPIQLKDAQAVHAEGEAILNSSTWKTFRNANKAGVTRLVVETNHPDTTGATSVGTNVYAKKEGTTITIFSTIDSKVFVDLYSGYELFKDMTDVVEMDVANLGFDASYSGDDYWYINLGSMFKNCSSLVSLDLSGWDFGADGVDYTYGDVQSGSSGANFMLEGCTSLKYLDISSLEWLKYCYCYNDDWMDSMYFFGEENPIDPDVIVVYSGFFYNWESYSEPGDELTELEVYLLGQESELDGYVELNYYILVDDEVVSLNDLQEKPMESVTLYRTQALAEAALAEQGDDDDDDVASTGVEVAVLPMVLTVVLGGVLLVTLKKKEQR